jgi:diguanylate cyclase (GGDEF)-like protein/PAS domain S-box-containing protein
MINVPPAIRLSVGLVFLTLSILLVAQVIGLTPNAHQQEIKVRQQMAETMAIQATIAVKRNDGQLLQALLNTLVSRNDKVLSAAVRRLDQTLLLQNGNHKQHWAPKENGHSTPTHVQLPIIVNGQERYQLEISLTPLGQSEKLRGMPDFLALMLFIAISGFVGYWIFISRALRYLDPSSVIPTRVKNALNILTEGILILDNKHQIVLINDTLANKLGHKNENFYGKEASGLNWILDNTDNENTVLPWEQVLKENISKSNVPMSLQIHNGTQQIFRVNTALILDEQGKCQGTMSSFDDVTELEEINQQQREMVLKLDLARKQVLTQNKELKFLATRDALTNCYNRRALFEFLNTYFAKAKEEGTQLSCIMADIDHFKRVNDTYGHTMGDKIIKMMADTFMQTVRDNDVVGRYGGEEFCIVLPGTPLDKAYEVAERCRKQMVNQDCDQVQVTASFGVTTIELGAEDPIALVNQADQALYISKESGRNRVTKWERQEEKSPMREDANTETKPQQKTGTNQ